MGTRSRSSFDAEGGAANIISETLLAGAQNDEGQDPPARRRFRKAVQSDMQGIGTCGSPSAAFGNCYVAPSERDAAAGIYTIKSG
jgi:hypothetical protein